MWVNKYIKIKINKTDKMCKCEFRLFKLAQTRLHVDSSLQRHRYYYILLR